MEDASKTVKDVLEAGAGYLSAKGVEQPRLACELLLSRLLDCRRLDLYLRFDQTLADSRLNAMRRGIKRVGEGEPVQYVTGQTEFMGHTIRVDPRVLIPRPETEGLVETVLACEALWPGPDAEAHQRPLIVDLGTGSGCVAIALAKARPEGVYVAVDVRADALELARANAEALQVADAIVFAEGELADCVEPESVSAIVCNPPYIASADVDRLPRHIRDHEPRTALDGGEDGLTLMRMIVQDAAMALAPGGRLFLEIGAGQAPAVRDLAEGCGFEDIAVRPDLAGHDRVVSARLAGASA